LESALPQIVLAAGGALAAGFILSHLLSRSKRAEAETLAASLARSEAHAREQTRLLARMQAEQAATAGLVRRLPEIVQDLNRSDLDPARIPTLLFSLVQDVFPGSQVLLYLVPPADDDAEAPDELVLREHRGLIDVPVALRRVTIGEGRIGFAAETKVEWSADDWLNQSRTEGRSFAENHPSLRLDLIGPLVHRGAEGNTLLGVLCVGYDEKAARPRDEKRLLQLITGLGSIAIMNTRRVAKLQAMANHDGLTGLLNKRHFLLELGGLIHKAERDNKPLGVFIFDIDHFKKFNDANGHVAGDELLKGLARLLRKSVRPGDLVGRYGGEEFLVVMPQTGREAALAMAERVREAVASFPFEHGDKQPLGRVTVSGGVSAFPVDGTQSQDLIRGADQALYEAKRGGRNRVLPFRGSGIGDPVEPVVASPRSTNDTDDR
jgi:diguanylate cyclase (GGDEF)-like protein